MAPGSQDEGRIDRIMLRKIHVPQRGYLPALILLGIVAGGIFLLGMGSSPENRLPSPIFHAILPGIPNWFPSSH